MEADNIKKPRQRENAPGRGTRRSVLMQEKRSGRPHRVRVERGIYQYYNGKYAVVYMVDGRPRFKTVGTKLTEARHVRDSLNVAAREGRLPTGGATRKFGEVADEFLGEFEIKVEAGERAERTLEKYRINIEKHLRSRFGARPIDRIRRRDIDRLISELRAAKMAPWTIRGVLVAASRVFAYGGIEDEALRNPVRELDKDRKPTTKRRTLRILKHDEIEALIKGATATYRPLLILAIYSGMRLSELLGLTWGDVDFDEGFIRVRYQLARSKEGQPPRRVRLKTESGNRDIPLLPQLATFLKRHKLASPYSGEGDFVLTSATGAPLGHRNAEHRGLTRAAGKAKLNPDGLPSLRMHDLRDTFVSHLIVDLRLDVVYVSRIVGHARPSVTLDIYSDLVDKARHAEEVRRRMGESDFGGVLDNCLTQATS